MGQNSSPTHDVFVSYSSKDKNWADAACAVLERHRVRCWIAPRDITPGDEWGAAIVKGIHDSRMMVLIFSGHANDSGQVRREVERAISQGMNVLPVRIEDIRPEGAMEYALGNMHWLDAFTPPVKQQLEVLARSVQTLLGREVEPAPAPAPAAAKPAAVAPVRSPEGARVIGDQPATTRANRRTEPKSDRLVESGETEDAMAAAPSIAQTEWPRWVWPAVALGVLMLGLFAAWMGGVFKVKTPDGVIVLENVPKDSEILVDGTKISFTWPGASQPVEIRTVPGQHRVEVHTEGFRTFGTDLTIKTEGSEEVTVRLEPLVNEPKVITNSIGMKLVLIPAGEFLMGSPDSDKDAEPQEKPQHRVRITRPFYLGATEVTQGQYRAVSGENPSHYKSSDDLPVEMVSWNDAIAFCNRLSEREGLKPFYKLSALEESSGDGYRLPTEAEWEYACRAGSTTRFSFGDDDASLEEYGWFLGNSDVKTHPVGQKRANAFGLYDMHGNDWEWCWDGYDKDYYRQSPGADPLGPSQAAGRVIRGGSWAYDPRSGRSANRNSNAPGYRKYTLGFRVARVQSGR
jgi:formylglycine-generating enzyme required for sulfatase activity